MKKYKKQFSLLCYDDRHYFISNSGDVILLICHRPLVEKFQYLKKLMPEESFNISFSRKVELNDIIIVSPKKKDYKKWGLR